MSSTRSSRWNRCAAISMICRLASRGRRAHCRSHRRDRRRAGRDRGERAASRVAERDLDVVERNTELLRRDLRHRGARARADVLHRGDDLRAAVGADADPGVRGRAAAAVPDLRRETDAVLPRALGCVHAPRRASPSAARRGGSTRRGSSTRTDGRRCGPSRRSCAAAARADRCPSFAASSSSRHSSANVPSTKPGARNAAIGGRFSFAG